MSAITTDYSANFADNSPAPRRGRPLSIYRQLARATFPEAKSERAIGNAVSLIRVAEAISETDPALYRWITDRRRLTVAYEIGRLPPDAIQPIAQQLHDLGESSASVMVSIVRMVRGSTKAERRGA
jgi:hypothetical protein